MKDAIVCAHCHFPLPESGSGLRHFGTYTAHQESECLRLLLAEIERLNGVVKVAEPSLTHSYLSNARAAIERHTRTEVLRELLEWEAHYMQQARGGNLTQVVAARADAAREIHDHLSSSWSVRDKA